MSIDKNDIKKLDTAGKLDYLLDAAMGLRANTRPSPSRKAWSGWSR